MAGLSRVGAQRKQRAQRRASIPLRTACFPKSVMHLADELLRDFIGAARVSKRSLPGLSGYSRPFSVSSLRRKPPIFRNSS